LPHKAPRRSTRRSPEGVVMLRCQSQPYCLAPVLFDRYYPTAVAFRRQTARQDFSIGAFNVGGKTDLGSNRVRVTNPNYAARLVSNKTICSMLLHHVENTQWQRCRLQQLIWKPARRRSALSISRRTHKVVPLLCAVDGGDPGQKLLYPSHLLGTLHRRQRGRDADVVALAA